MAKQNKRYRDQPAVDSVTREYFNGLKLTIPIGHMKASMAKPKVIERTAPPNSAIGLMYGDEQLWDQWLVADTEETFNEWLARAYRTATCWDCQREYFIPTYANFLLCEHCRAGTPSVVAVEKRSAYQPMKAHRDWFDVAIDAIPILSAGFLTMMAYMLLHFLWAML